MPPLELKLNKPCNDCPYRKDAPLQKWAKEEFEDLAKNENEKQAFRSYGCHKKNGSYCIGWLVANKRLNDNYESARDGVFPSIAYSTTFATLRMSGMEGMLDEIDKNTPPLYRTVKEMILANYPQLKINDL